jgi:hypothetical protein
MIGRWRLRPAGVLQNRFYIRYRGAVDSLERPHLQARTCDFANRDSMQSEWIRAVGRSGEKHTGEWGEGVIAWMDFQSAAVGLVQPCDEEDFMPRSQTFESVHKLGRNFEPRIGRALVALPRSDGAGLKFRSNKADRDQCVAVGRIHDSRSEFKRLLPGSQQMIWSRRSGAPAFRGICLWKILW